MALLTSTPEPRDGGTLLKQALASIYQPDATHAQLRQLEPGATQFGAHHALFDLAPEKVANGGGLDQAVRTASRYLVMSHGMLRAAFEISTDEQGLIAGEFRSANDGPFVQGTEKAIRLAESLPGDERCTISMVRMAPLKLMILLVKPPAAPPHCYVVEPAPHPFDSNRPYAVAELLALLRPLAQALGKHAAGPGFETLAG